MNKINEFFLRHPVLEGVFSGVICGLLILVTFWIILTARGY